MCGCLGTCTCPARSTVSASQALAGRRAATPRRLGHLVNFGSPAVPFPGAETGSAPSYEQPTSIWRLDRLRRSRCCGSQKWEPTYSVALGRSTTRSDSSRRSVAPHSTQSDGDRRPDPLWISLTPAEEVTGSNPVRPHGIFRDLVQQQKLDGSQARRAAPAIACEDAIAKCD